MWSTRNVIVVLVAQMVALFVYKTIPVSTFRTIFYQTLQYYSRPHVSHHSNYIYQPISNSNSLWNGTYMRDHPEVWSEWLTPDDILCFETAIQHFQGLNKSLSFMSASDFPVTSLVKAKINRWKLELTHEGRGFVVVKGVPVQKWTAKQTEIFYAALGQHMGVPGEQDSSGGLLGHVKDTGADARNERQYKTKDLIVYHCDAADVVGLLCLHPAKKGGSSRIISSTSVYNQLLQLPKGQQYARRLYQSVLMDTRGTASIRYAMIRPFSIDSNNVVRIFYHMEYFRSAYTRFDHLPPMDDETKEALDAVDTILNNDEHLHMDMELQPGDIQLISNHYILHSRTAFEDYTAEETAADPSKQPRHLLRLWVSLDLPSSWSNRISKSVDFVKVLGDLVYARLTSNRN